MHYFLLNFSSNKDLESIRDFFSWYMNHVVWYFPQYCIHCKNGQTLPGLGIIDLYWIVNYLTANCNGVLDYFLTNASHVANENLFPVPLEVLTNSCQVKLQHTVQRTHPISFPPSFEIMLLMTGAAYKLVCLGKFR